MAVSTIKLTETQEKCVTFKPQGDLLIQGIPGSGKSTILLARAQYLKEKHPNDTVMVLTFSRALTNYIRQLSLKTHSKQVEAKTFHQWGQELIRQTDYPHTKLIVSDVRKDTIRYAKNIVNKYSKKVNFPQMKESTREESALLSFLCDEIEWIKGLGIKSRDEYLSMVRAGRGKDIRVLKEHRNTIYDVLEKYNELLNKHPKRQGIDGDDLAKILIEKVNQIPSNLKPDHILVDEAQDLNTMQIKAISKMANKSLTIGADKGQQIYRRSFSWKQAGVDIKGTRNIFLKQTFRSTREIIRLANHFQEQDKLYIKDEDYHKAQEPDVSGKVPEICFCNNNETEKKFILEHVKKIRTSYPNDTIGIISFSHDKLDELKKLLELKGIPVYKVKDNEADIISPGVKLITYHSSKGLEFDHVIVTDLKKGKVPYHSPSPGEDEEEFFSRERKKLYVAMTRAKKTLTLIAIKEYSPFIDDMNKKYYQIIKES
jgi:superfamily I DNA/RNA helicase